MLIDCGFFFADRMLYIGRPVRTANRQRRVKPAIIAASRIPEILMSIDT
jgi:hypothetical protein